MASDLVGTFVVYRVQTAVWREWAGDPEIIAEERKYGATWSELEVTVSAISSESAAQVKP